ncbi:MAG: tetratricopeptide repeat protein, partial [Myxococcales bacterium]|nr:tetratricopeptide repeat protein [Myxococcales bacterium]
WATRLRELGQAHRRAGDAGSAAAYFRDALEIDPSDGEAYEALGSLYLAARRFDDALAVFEAGAHRRPGRIEIWRGLAAALEGRGDRLEAEDALGRLLALEPWDERALLDQARLALDRGAFSLALNAHRRLIDAAAMGRSISSEALARARRAARALILLVGDLDPAYASCEPAASGSAIRRALAGCPPLEAPGGSAAGGSAGAGIIAETAGSDGSRP